jgi:hypothetical protein
MRLSLCLFLFSGFLISCSRVPLAEKTTVALKFPTASEWESASVVSQKLKGDVGFASAVTYEKLCFAINIINADYPPVAPTNTCDITRGKFMGSVAPGQSLQIDLSEGIASFEVYGFLRNSSADTCPTMGETGWNWPMAKIYFLGSAMNVSVKVPETNVAISVNIPSVASQNIVAENSWSPSCNKIGAPPIHQAPGRLSLGATKLSGSTVKAYVRVSSNVDTKTLSGTSVKIKNWKSTQ